MEVFKILLIDWYKQTGIQRILFSDIFTSV